MPDDTTTVVAPGGVDDVNPYAARLAADPGLGEVGFWDRASANLEDSWMRGSLFGAGSLMGARSAVDDPNTNPRVRALMSTYLDRAAIDMARYEAMPSARGASENLAAILGQIGGGVGSPEGLVTRVPGVGRLFNAERFIGRVAESAATQGIVNTATDPLVQAASIQSGVQKEYDIARTALAPVVGAAAGGLLHASAEGVTAAAKALEEAFRGRPAGGAPQPGPGAPQADGAAPAPDGLPLETGKAGTAPKGEDVFTPGDRVTVNDYGFGPDVPAGPYNGMSGTIIDRHRGGYTIRLDDGTQTSFGEMLLTPKRSDGAAPPAAQAAPAPTAAGPADSPLGPDDAQTASSRAQLPVTPPAALASSKAHALHAPGADSRDLLETLMSREETAFQSGPDFYTDGANPREAYAQAMASVPEEVRSQYIAHGISATRGGTRTEALAGMLADRPESMNAGPLLPTAEEKATGIAATRIDAPYILVFRKDRPTSDGPAAVIVNSRDPAAVDAARKAFPNERVLSPEEAAAQMKSGGFEPAEPTRQPLERGPTQSEPGAPRRELGLPLVPGDHISMARNTVLPLTQYPDYTAAKGGDPVAAARTVVDLVPQSAIDQARARWGSDVVYVPVTAEERSGRNALPLATAMHLADETGAGVSLDIAQTNRAYHTGAKAMHRILTRATFDGPVERGARYVIVDDVTTMGSTIADLADHIQRGGGEVVGAFTLADRIRDGLTKAPADVVARIRRKFGDDIFSTFGLAPEALTADEARFLDHARSLDALRGRIAEAVDEGHGRPDQGGTGGGEAQAPAAGGLTAPAGRRLIGARVPGMGSHRVATTDGGTVDVVPVVVEARDLIASSDARYDKGLQPRARDRAASQAQIRSIAAHLDPERLGLSSEADRGAPIVGDDKMVESGNGRVIALRNAYDQGGEAAGRYRAWLEQHGVDTAGFDQPVLVRQRITPMSEAERRAFTVSANQAATLGMSASERAMADARIVSDEMLATIRNPDDLGAVANRDFIRSFVGELPVSERGGMMTAEGGLSSEGLARMRNAVLSRAYGDAATLARIAEATADDVKSISSALVAVAPEWAKLRADIEAGRVRPDLDVTPELLDAVSRTADMRAKGQKLDTYLAQIDAFDKMSPEVEGFMRMFADPKGRRAASAQKVAERLRAYATEARKVAADAGLELGLPRVTVQDLQAHAATIGNADADAAPGSQDRLFRRSNRDGQGDATDGRGGPGDAGVRQQSGDPRARSGQGREAVSGRAGEDLQFRKGGVAPPPVAGAGGATPAGRVESLQRQTLNLAEELGVPLREGRVQGGKAAQGQFDTSQGVARVRVIADFGTVAHEMGHALEKRVPELANLIRRNAAELGPLDYDATRQDPREGFAEFARMYMEAPAAAQNAAPNFGSAFHAFMRAAAPDVLAKIDAARDAHTAWLSAPSGVKLAATVKRQEAKTVIGAIEKDGLPATISTVISKAYQMIFDDKAPVVLAVRDLARQAWKASGARLNLEGWSNPAALVRLFGRAHQAAVGDMKRGVRPYHSIHPQGPSLRDALVTATGKPGWFGHWDDAKMEEFSQYLVARRGEYLWRKYEAGQLPNRPLSLSKADVVDAMAKLEKENRGFKAGSSMVHEYTRQLLTKMFDGGLIARELHDKLQHEEFYVPFYRHREDKPLEAQKPQGAKTSDGPGTAELVKRIRGSDRDIVDPIQSIMTQTFLVNRTLAHNDILKSFVNLARTARKAGAIEAGKILEEIPPYEVTTKRFDLAEAVANAARENGTSKDDLDVLLGSLTDVFGDDPIMAPIFRREAASKRGEPILFYKEGGELKAVRLISKAEDETMGLYEALAELPSQARDVAMWLGNLGATAKRAGIVTNPIFAVTNWTRDQLAATILRPDFIPFNPAGIVKELGQTQAAQLYLYAGGVSPGAGQGGLDEMFRGDMAALAHNNWALQKVSSIGDLAHGKFLDFAKSLGEFAEVGEAGTRLNVMSQVFRQKIKQGFNEYDAMLEAAYQATDLMDFGRHGSMTGIIRKLIPFLNAHFVALDKAGRTLLAPLYKAIRGDLVTQNDVRDLKNAGLAWFKMAGLGGAFGYMYGLWASQHEAYRDANDRLRASHLIVPGDAFGQQGVQLVIPKPFELAIGFNLGELAGLHAATGDPRVGQFALDGLDEVLEPPSLLTDIPIVSTVWQDLSNYSQFTKRPIVPDRLAGLEPSEQYTDRTSPFGRMVGKALGVSPIKVDFTIGDMFGLWGRDLLAASSTVDENAPSLKDTQMFGLRRVLKDANVSSETTRMFWDKAGSQTGEYAVAKNTYEAMLGQYRDAEAQDYLSHLPADKRAYVTLQSAADEDGKAVFTAADKRLHPYVRAADAALTINAYIRELQTNTQHEFEDGKRVPMDPPTRRALIDNMRQLQAMEQRNAAVILKEPGYVGRKIMSTEDQFGVIMEINPAAGLELATRYATAKIVPTDAVAKLWPEAQKRLLQEGGSAQIDDLSSEAAADGYAFGAARVVRPRKRRVVIPAGVQLAPPP